MGRGGVVRPEVRLGRPGGGWLGADLGAFSAIKIRVDNSRGLLKLGMPVDVQFGQRP